MIIIITLGVSVVIFLVGGVIQLGFILRALSDQAMYQNYASQRISLGEGQVAQANYFLKVGDLEKYKICKKKITEYQKGCDFYLKKAAKSSENYKTWKKYFLWDIPYMIMN